MIFQGFFAFLPIFLLKFYFTIDSQGNTAQTLYHNLCGLFFRQNHQKYSTIFPISPPFFDSCDEKISTQILQSGLCGIALKNHHQNDLERSFFSCYDDRILEMYFWI